MRSSGADEKEIYGDAYRSVYAPKRARQQVAEQDMGFGAPCPAPAINMDYDDDVLRSSPAMDYDDDVFRSSPTSSLHDDYNNDPKSLYRSMDSHAPTQTDSRFGPVEGYPIEMGVNMNAKTLGLQMAKQQQHKPQQQGFRNRQTQDFFCEDESDDQSSDGGMMMEEEYEPMAGQSGCGLPFCPSHYRRDSTYLCATSEHDTVEAIHASLEAVKHTGLKGHVKFVEYSQNNGQFEGMFYEDARYCEFVVSAYVGADRIWVELKHMSNGFNCKQAFDSLFVDVVRFLTDCQVFIGLVDPTFQPRASIQKPLKDSHKREPVNEPASPQLKQIVKDRVDALNGAQYLGEQQALTGEILRIAKDHPNVVAETKNVGKVFLRFWKTSKKDIQLTRTILSIMLILKDNQKFNEQNKRKLVQALLTALGSDKAMCSAQGALARTQPENIPRYNGGGGEKRRHKDIPARRSTGRHYNGPAMTTGQSTAAQRQEGPDDDPNSLNRSAGGSGKASVKTSRQGLTASTGREEFLQNGYRATEG